MSLTTYHLEMFARPPGSVPPPRPGLSVRRVTEPSVAYYRQIYDAVGSDYRWRSKHKLADVELAALLADPRIEVHVLSVDGQDAGFAEFDRRVPDEIEMVQFGLTPEFIGQGLGQWFLRWTIDQAFSHRPKRFWLHTCTKDHPRALPNYLRAGFVLFKEETTE